LTPYTSLKAMIYAAARQDAGLQALLLGGSPPIFNFWDTQLAQGSLFPAVVVNLVSNPRDYATTGRLPTSWARVQFTVYGTGNDSKNADLVVAALIAFLDTFNAATGSPGAIANPTYVLGDRDGGIAITQPMTYQRFVDARIFWNPAAPAV
jgi:hypothetical protein